MNNIIAQSIRFTPRHWVIAAARNRLKDGSLVELSLKPHLKATARFAYVTLAGRTGAPAMAYFRQFVRAHLNEQKVPE